ncbi:MAG: lysozyme family protein [Minisyncoccota bacterium]
MNPMVQMAVVASNPKEIRSEDYQPITDPKNVERFINDYFADIPILKEVAFCESTFRHFNKDGSVRRGIVNKYDVGVMQINELYHAKEAASLGIDLETVDGNVAFARHLYERSGSQPWSSSGPCWDRSEKSEDLAIK